MIEISQTRVRRRDRRWRWLALAVFVAVFLFVFLAQGSRKEESEVQAASLANFDPGYIISDYQMGNYNSMNEAEIQAWLTSKNSCPNTNYDYYLQLSANTNYTWHWENGHFVCLSEELFGDGEVIGSGETAAHIIWQTAQDYHINPQVILVLLQKETGLITDPIPNNGDYRKATGYGCPDTAPCSSQYYGFKNQVRKAAALFRTVLDGGWTNYPLGDNYIQYNPSTSCGGSVVNIRSLATSALYRYTPYQPNEGALAAGYGTAYCGAYGNRNFYLYFEDWFGGITDVKIDTSVTEENASDELTWELYRAMLEEASETVNVGELDDRFNISDKVTRLKAIKVIWELFGCGMNDDSVFDDTFSFNLFDREAIRWAYKNGITKYYSVEGEFAPNTKITRREAMIFLWRYAGQPVVDVDEVRDLITDLPDDDLGQSAIAWAYKNGITKYYSVEGEFAPNTKITRREAMIFLWRYAGQPVVGAEVFNDLPDDIESQSAIAWAYRNGITRYYSVEGEFAPNMIATRREAAIFISRAFSYQ